jgi:hypothetical protein
MSLIALVLIIAMPAFSQGNNQEKGNDSVEIRVEKGQSLMEDVFNRFHINYEMSRTHKVGYYQESMSDSVSTYYFAEGIVDIYIPCNLNKVENASISPIRARKTIHKEVGQENLLLGNASDMARSSIWRPNSFLSEKNRDDYTFIYTEDKEINGADVLVIEFEPKKDHGLAVGKIFIDKQSFAIVKVEYTPIIRKSKVWKSVSWTEEFRYKNGAYELNRVKFHGLGADNNYQYDAILVMDQLEVVSRIPDYEVFIREDVSLFEKAKEEQLDSFWEGFGFLKQYLKTDNLFIASKSL